MTRASGSAVETRASGTGRSCLPRARARALAASRSGRIPSARRTRLSRSRVARSRAAAVRRLVAPGSSSSSARNAATWAVASSSARPRPRRPRYEPAPAEARTRTPSWATRARLTSPAGEERRHALDEELVEELGGLHPEVGQGVVVDPHAAGDPAVRVVLVTQAVEGPRRADPLEGGVQPERDEDRGVDRRASAVALGRPDPRVEGGEIEALDEGPHQARPVLGRQEALEVGRAQPDLLAARLLEPRSTPPLGYP